MSDAVPRDPRTEVRRRNRAVEDEAWIRAVLHAAPAGVLATADGGQPFVNSNLFVYDEGEHVIYLHTAARGRTRTTVLEHPAAAFTVFEIGRLVPAPLAVDFTAEYASVVVFGQLAIVDDPGHKRAVLGRWFTKYWPELAAGRDFVDVTDAEVARTTVYRLAIESWSGKQNRQPADAPGARPHRGPPLMALEPRADDGAAGPH